MSLRNRGIKYTDEQLGLTVWMHAGEFFNKRLMVGSAIDTLLPYDDSAQESGNHAVNNMRAAFLFIEAFLLDYECLDNEDLPIVKYLKTRHPFNVRANLERFLLDLAYQDIEFVFAAYSETRPEQDETTNTENTEDEKKSSD